MQNYFFQQDPFYFILKVIFQRKVQQLVRYMYKHVEAQISKYSPIKVPAVAKFTQQVLNFSQFFKPRKTFSIRGHSLIFQHKLPTKLSQSAHNRSLPELVFSEKRCIVFYRYKLLRARWVVICWDLQRDGMGAKCLIVDKLFTYSVSCSFFIRLLEFFST